MLDYSNILSVMIEEIEATRAKCAALLQDLPLSIATEVAEITDGFDDMREDLLYIRDEKLVAQALFSQEQRDTGYYDYLGKLDHA